MRNYPRLEKSIRSTLPGCALAALLIVTAGCATTDQRHASLANKPNMQFSDSDLFKCQNKLGSQTEPGSALSGGAQSAGQNCCK